MPDELTRRPGNKSAASTPPAPSTPAAQGKSFPLGATVSAGGTNFSVFAKHSMAAQLVLFDHAEDARPSRVIELDPYDNHT